MENQEKIWDEIANDWSKYRKKPAKEVEEFLKNTKGNYLDLGCGSGRNFIPLKNTESYATDFSSEMLKQAEEKAKKFNIKLIKAKSSKLPFQENFFDKILCYSVLHCIPTKSQREKTIKEIARVLKKGGLAYISVWSKNSPRLKNKPKECFIPWTTKNKKIKRYTYIFSKQEIKKLLEKNKLKILKITENQNLSFLVTK